jgi:very-short-patch-repair endonuclease
MSLIHNHKYLKEFRKDLRNNATDAEKELWQYLKGCRAGMKIRRQHSIGNYIVDFYCPEARLIIELDGEYHFTEEGIEYDKQRTAYLTSLGFRVIRFENKLVFENPEYVLAEIKKALKTSPQPPPH